MAGKALTDLKIQQIRTPGVWVDGDGLRLKVTQNAKTKALRKSWVLRVTVKGGAEREVGLGSSLTLAKARAEAKRLRDLAREGVDPIMHRRAELAERAAEAARAMTFRQAAEKYIELHRSSWRNAKHASQWTNTLATYVYPEFGDVSVHDVDVAMVMKVLDPIWRTKTETASRIRQRIEVVLDWAAVRGHRSGENPARWRGHLQKALPNRTKAQRVRHQPALEFEQMPQFWQALQQQEARGARAFQFMILNCTRTSETLNARWSEFDLKKAVWTIPGDRMKAEREHRVPLAPASIAILESMLSFRSQADGDWVFPGAKKGRPFSNMVFLKILERMGVEKVTGHGFRATFRDWAAERTNFSRDVAEMALAHTISDKVEAAYRRGDLFEKRRKLLEAWASYCTSPPAEGNIVSLRGGSI